jgi:hypothetical protein
MARVGREAIEASLESLGMADPRRNRPFLTTRELSLLKWGIPKADRDDYLAGDSAARRRFLDTPLPRTNATQLPLVATPVAVDQLEWFASAADLCKVHVALQELAKQPAVSTIRSMLSTNPGVGIEIDRSTWTYVGFKGGSEAGVLALSWYLERVDGHRFVVVALLKDERQPISSGIARDIAGAFPLLAKR